jgi:Tol biopolymer transport system component
LAWLADGKHLVVRQESSPLTPGTTPWQQGNHAGRLVSVDLASGAINPLTWPPSDQMGDFAPSVSPDGHTIAFIRFAGSNLADIFLVPASGGEARRLTNYRSEIAGIAWTPDRRKLVFAMARNSDVRLLRIGIANPKIESILSSTDFMSRPTVARRGDRLAYVAQNGRVDLRRMKLQETSPPKTPPDEPLIATTRYHGNPMYSPDGRKLAFHSNRSGSVEIWVSDADGSHLAQLTNCGGTNNGTPRWSPDGSLIAFDSRSTGNAEIFVVSSEGGGLRQITNNPAEDVVPSWSRDGKWIYFASNRNGDFQIWRASAAQDENSTAAAIQVTKDGGFDGLESSDGKYLYFAKGRGKSGLWRKELAGGFENPEQPVLPSIQNWGWWALGKTGVFYFEAPPKPNGTIAVKYLNLASGKMHEISRLRKPLNPWNPTVTVSPDERFLVYEQPEQIGSNIVLVENFR